MLIGSYRSSVMGPPAKIDVDNLGSPPQQLARHGGGDADAAAADEAAALLDAVYKPPPSSSSATWAPAPLPAGHSDGGRCLATDGLAVLCYVGLYYETRDARRLAQAEALIAAVHDTLGRERCDSGGGGGGSASVAAPPPRLPGASDAHPTRGGLRAGKPDPEDHPDGDGQALLALLRWAHALLQAAAAADAPRYLRWALELAHAAHGAFYDAAPEPRSPRSVGVDAGGASPPPAPGFAVKMSVDLQRALVAPPPGEADSSGVLEPYAALVTYALLQAAAERMLPRGGCGGGAGSDAGAAAATLPSLTRELADARAAVDARYERFFSDDAGQLGDALWVSHWQLTGSVVAAPPDSPGPRCERHHGSWADHVAAAALRALDLLWENGQFEGGAADRSADAELSAALGLTALVTHVPALPRAREWAGRVAPLLQHWRAVLAPEWNGGQGGGGGDACCAHARVLLAACVLPRALLKG